MVRELLKVREWSTFTDGGDISGIKVYRELMKLKWLNCGGDVRAGLEEGVYRKIINSKDFKVI